jgi:hypothetical protein
LSNTYGCFYRGKSIQVKEETTYKAQQEAAKQFKAKKSWEVSVMLMEKDGEEVIHDPAVL